MTSKVVGIIGGMGPLSTVEFMRKVIGCTPSLVEQEHIRMLVDSRPEIPDRTAFIRGKGTSPVPMLRESAELLEKWGAGFLAIPCNTAHHFLPDICEAVHIPVLDMLKLVGRELEKRFEPGAAVGLLATTGSLQTRLFHKYLPDFSLITPPEDVQWNVLMDAIYGKKGIKTWGNTERNRRKILRAVRALLPHRPVCIIAGCTEVGLVLENVSVDCSLINPLDLLAKEVVRRARD